MGANCLILMPQIVNDQQIVPNNETKSMLQK